jgi:hypothetical protein
MSVYLCAVCDSFVDNDWHPCTEMSLREDNPSVKGLVCPECFVELPEAEEKPKEFTSLQRLFIKKMEEQEDDC